MIIAAKNTIQNDNPKVEMNNMATSTIQATVFIFQGIFWNRDFELYNLIYLESRVGRIKKYAFSIYTWMVQTEK